MAAPAFVLTGLQAALSAVGGVKNGLDDLRPAWPAVHKIFIDFEDKVFSSQGAYTGDDWVPLNPDYAIYKERSWPGQTIMKRDGELFKSLTKPGHADHVYRTGPGFVEMGTKRLYARAQHFGYEQTNLPARKIIPKFTKEQGEAVVDVIMKHLFKQGRSGVKASIGYEGGAE